MKVQKCARGPHIFPRTELGLLPFTMSRQMLSACLFGKPHCRVANPRVRDAAKLM